MKFRCGLTRETKLSKSKKESQDLLDLLTGWHDIFAWLPIKVGDNDCRWLEIVQRRYECGSIRTIYSAWGQKALSHYVVAFNPEYRPKQPR